MIDENLQKRAKNLSLIFAEYVIEWFDTIVESTFKKQPLYVHLIYFDPIYPRFWPFSKIELEKHTAWSNFHGTDWEKFQIARSCGPSQYVPLKVV